MKSHLKKVASNLNFTYEEFATILIRKKAVLNSRPMSPLTENPSDLFSLTPGHLLRGAPIIASPSAPEEPPLRSLRRSHLGRITNVIYGKDNKRVEEIKTQNGTITRSIAKLCILPTSHTEDKIPLKCSN
ncbi:hypothetical protein CVS40_11233 [Lucilia cuprina]|nr:hypothetical protein CVS40_11233 [Lucilia cuprina]